MKLYVLKALACALIFYQTANAQDRMAPIRIGMHTTQSGSEVSIFKESEIENSSSSDVGDFLQNRGYPILRQGGEGQTSGLNIRGAEAEHVLVLVDGVPLNDASNPSRTFDLSRIPLSEIRRIELIKGPQTVRYGYQALGGVLRLWTYATQEKAEYALGGKVGNLKSSEVHAGVLHPLGAGFQLGVNGQFYETEGFSAASGGEEKDSHRSQSGSASLGYSQDHFRTQYAFRRVNQITDIDNGGGASNDDPDNIARFRQDSHSLITQVFPSDDFQSQLVLGHSDLERHYTNLPSRGTYFGEQSRAELSFDKNFGDNWSTTLGLEATEEKAKGETNTSTFPSSKIHKEDAFALVEYRYTDWTFNLGARIENHSEYGEEWSDEAGIGYWLTEFQRIQVRWARGTRWPSLFQLYDPTYGNSDLSPERSKSLELAWSLAKDNYTASITMFQTEYDNLLDYDSVTFRTINQGEARVRGVETEASVSTGNWLHAFRYQYLQPRNTENDTELIRRPRHEAFLSETYQFSEGSLSAWVRYRGKREDRDPATFTPVELPEYWLFGLRSQYDFESFRLWASIENLLNKPYEDVAGYNASPRRFWLGFDIEI